MAVDNVIPTTKLDQCDYLKRFSDLSKPLRKRRCQHYWTGSPSCPSWPSFWSVSTSTKAWGSPPYVRVWKVCSFNSILVVLVLAVLWIIYAIFALAKLATGLLCWDDRRDGSILIWYSGYAIWSLILCVVTVGAYGLVVWGMQKSNRLYLLPALYMTLINIIIGVINAIICFVWLAIFR